MYRNLSKITAHRKRLWSKLVVPKKHFLFDNRKEFLEHSVSLSHESSCENPLLNKYCIYYRRTLAAMNCIYTTYLIDISI